MQKLWKAAFSSWIFAILLLAASAAAAEEAADKPAEGKSKKDDYYTLMKVFVDSFDQVDRNYVKDVDRRELIQAAIEGMMSRLDPYSTYISPEEMARFSETVDQEFGGIGIQVSFDENTKRLVVVSPLPGTPAFRAGVLPGDVITEIEGKTTDGFTSVEPAVKLLKGKPGTSVKFTVRHKGGKSQPISVVRDVIHVATVLGNQPKSDGSWDYMVDKQNKIGYVRLTHFSRHSAIELEKAVNELLEQGMKGFVLDLRFDPGGLFSQATEISDMFIEGGTIVSTKGRNSRERTWEAKKEGTFPNFPMAIIVNHFSASASEIVSACLQDHHRAVIVGERTWGKGSVQNVIELEGGSSALKLTTASYHRPSGVNIHRFPGATESDVWGVKPDPGYEVKSTPEETREYYDHYRSMSEGLGKDGATKTHFKDRQLDKALETVRAKLASTQSPKKAKPEEKGKPGGAADKKAAAHTPAIPRRAAAVELGVG